jgi:hypothetical protein
VGAAVGVGTGVGDARQALVIRIVRAEQAYRITDANEGSRIIMFSNLCSSF